VKRTLNSALIGGGLVLLVLAAGYFFQMPWALSTWFWPDGRLSYIFVASIQVAIAAAMIWIGLSYEYGSLAAGALNLLVMMAGIAAFLFPLASQQNQPYLLVYAVGCGLFAVFNLWLFLWSRRLPVAETQPTPGLVSISYAIFAAVLILVGGALVLKTPNVFPWPLKPETSVVFGWIFIGDAFYFLHAFLRRTWQSARAQLWSFLAYDLVLIGPFLAHLAVVKPELLTSLLVYMAVLVYSGGLAIYYLFINRSTRAWSTNVDG